MRSKFSSEAVGDGGVEVGPVFLGGGHLFVGFFPRKLLGALGMEGVGVGDASDFALSGFHVVRVLTAGELGMGKSDLPGV